MNSYWNCLLFLTFTGKAPHSVLASNTVDLGLTKDISPLYSLSEY